MALLSHYGRREWLTIVAIGAMLTVVLLIVGWWWLALLAVVGAVALLTFFRDPNRSIPAERGVVVSPADGRVSSVHRVEHFPPFNGPATCVRVFLSVLNVHVNRCPCHGMVGSITHKPGQHRNALNPASADDNESNLIVLLHPANRQPLAAVRQVAGLIARTIVCGLDQGQIVQRGQRFGMIKFGSTAELYLPDTCRPEVRVQQGQRVYGGSTVLAKVAPPTQNTSPEMKIQTPLDRATQPSTAVHS